VSEIALGLTEVVGFGVVLGGERLVGDLAIGPMGVGVVGGGSGGGPLDEAAAVAQGGGASLIAEQQIPLGIDDHGAVAGVDRAGEDPRKGDGLAGAGGSDDERVGAAVGAKREADDGPVGVEADRETAGGEGRAAAGEV